MTDGPQQCALPGCNEMVEQPEDGGPRRLYCSPAHRAAARKMRHAARMDSAAPQQAASDVTQPVARAPRDEQSEQPTIEQPTEQPTTELPAPLGVSTPDQPEPAPEPEREWSPAAAWTVSPPTLPASTERTVRTITSQRVKKQKPARTAADRKNAATHVRRRAIASVAIASLVAGGASYFVSENVIPTTPTPLPPNVANQPSMDADVWADKAQVVLASLSSQLDAVAQAEADWLALPAQRRAQEPAAVQALKDRKALLEQQRAILMSQLDAFRTLPERTSELTSAQAQLDAVERTLNESTTTAASPDYKEALRQLESQREIRRQQRDHAAKALTDLRNGVEQALSSPLPAEKDETSPIVERVKAVVAGRPDPGDKDKDEKHSSADEQEPAANPRREDGDEERGDVGTTAPPDPERPNTPDILADGSRDSGPNGGSDGGSKGDDKSDGPVQTIAGSVGGALGQGDSTNRDERSNKRESRDDDGKKDRDDSRGGLGGVVRDVGGTLLGGSDRNDDGDDDREDRRERSSDRDDDRDSKNDRSSSWSDRDDDDDDRGSRRDRDDDDDDRGGLIRDISDGLLGGDDDSDRKKPSGKAERERTRDKDREERHEKDASDKDGSDDERADKDDDRKKPSGKAERERKRDKDREEREHRDKDDDEKDEDDDGDRKGSDKKDKDDDGDSDKGKDRGDSDDDGDDDGGKSDNKDKGDDDGGDSGGSDSGDSDSGGDDD